MDQRRTVQANIGGIQHEIAGLQDRTAEDSELRSRFRMLEEQRQKMVEEFVGLRREISRIDLEVSKELEEKQQERWALYLSYFDLLREERSVLIQLYDPLKEVLAKHNTIEEGSDGVYAECDRIVGPELFGLLSRLYTAAEVPVAKHVDSEKVEASARRALTRAPDSIRS